MKQYSESTLMKMSKADLVEYIKILYHNLEVATESYERATKFYCEYVTEFAEKLKLIK